MADQINRALGKTMSRLPTSRLLFLFILQLSFPVFAQEPVAQAHDDRMVLVRVNDQLGSPISGAKVQLYCRTEFDFVNPTFESDDAGIAIVSFPQAGHHASITVHKSGLVPHTRRWQMAGDEVPDECTITLSPATDIGGFVKNKRGEPVDGARVALTITETSTSIFSDAGQANMLVISDQLAPITDSAGRWTYGSAPLDGNIRLQITHADYVGISEDAGSTKQEYTQSEIRKGEAVAVLSDGVRIDGTVLSENGRGVSKPRLVMKLVAEGYHPPVDALGDEQGRFRMPAVADGKYRIGCFGEGFAPKLLTINTKTDRSPFSIKLQPGRTVRIRVADPDDQPLKASVTLMQVQNDDLSFVYSSQVKPSFPTFTDSAGRFEWTCAPEAKLKFNVRSAGFGPTEVELSDDEQGDEKLVQLEREGVLVGQVIDRLTREPIDRFLLIPFDVGTSIFRPMGVVGRKGKFELPLDNLASRFPKFHLMIEHSGHKTILTDEAFGKSKSAKDVLFEMEAAEASFGIIVDAEGKPIRDAVVVLSERSTGLFKTPSMELGRVLTSSEGNFSFPAPPGDFSISATSSEGFLSENFDDHQNDLGKLSLKKWSSVKGRVLDRDGNPCENCTVIIVPRRNSAAKLPRSQTTSDRDGRFQFDRVPSVPCELWAYTRPNDKGVSENAATKKIEIPPGEQITVDVKLD